QELRDSDMPGRSEKVEAVIGDRSLDGCAACPPIGNERIQSDRIDDRSGENVRPDLGTFFNDADAEIGSLFCRALLQTNRSGKSGRTRADNDDIELHAFARFAHRWTYGMRRIRRSITRAPC